MTVNPEITPYDEQSEPATGRPALKSTGRTFSTDTGELAPPFAHSDPSPHQPHPAAPLNSSLDADASCPGAAVWLPGVADRIISFLAPTDICLVIRPLCRALAAQYAAHTTAHLSHPVHPAIFAAHWDNERALRRLGLARRQDLIRLAARSGVLPNLQLALRVCGLAAPPPLALAAAAAGGHVAACELLHGLGAPFANALSAAAGGGHRVCCEWLLGRGCAWDEAAVRAAAKGGHVELMVWLLERTPQPGQGQVLGQGRGRGQQENGQAGEGQKGQAALPFRRSAAPAKRAPGSAATATATATGTGSSSTGGVDPVLLLEAVAAGCSLQELQHWYSAWFGPAAAASTQTQTPSSASAASAASAALAASAVPGNDEPSGLGLLLRRDRYPPPPPELLQQQPQPQPGRGMRGWSRPGSAAARRRAASPAARQLSRAQDHHEAVCGLLAAAAASPTPDWQAKVEWLLRELWADAAAVLALASGREPPAPAEPPAPGAAWPAAEQQVQLQRQQRELRERRGSAAMGLVAEAAAGCGAAASAAGAASSASATSRAVGRLRWLAAHLGPEFAPDSRAAEAAARAGDAAALSYLRGVGVRLADGQVELLAADSGSVACLQVLEAWWASQEPERGPELDEVAAAVAGPGLGLGAAAAAAAAAAAGPGGGRWESRLHVSTPFRLARHGHTAALDWYFATRDTDSFSRSGLLRWAVHSGRLDTVVWILRRAARGNAPLLPELAQELDVGAAEAVGAARAGGSSGAGGGGGSGRTAVLFDVGGEIGDCGWQFDVKLFSQAAAAGNVEVLGLIRRLAPELGPEAAHAWLEPARSGDLLTLRALGQLGCPADGRGDIFTRAVFAHGMAAPLPALRLMLEEARVSVCWNDAVAAAARRRADASEVVAWLAAQQGRPERAGQGVIKEEVFWKPSAGAAPAGVQARKPRCVVQ